MAYTVHATLAAGETARVERVELSYAHPVLTVWAGPTRLYAWGRDDLVIEGDGEGGTATIEHAELPDVVVHVRDPHFLSALRTASGTSLLGRLGRGKQALVLLAAVGSIAFGAFTAAPAVARAIAAQVPRSVEATLAPHLDTWIGRGACTTQDAEAALATLSERLDPSGHLGARVSVVNLPIANAFTMPGGVVVLTRGLLEEAASPDEVAGVLAHELAHIEHRHVMANVVRTTLLASLWAMTVGDLSGLMVVDPRTAYDVATLRFSRDDEAEADATALALMAAARISPAPLAQFFTRNDFPGSDALELLSTHPGGKARAARLEAAKPGDDVTASLEPEAWSALQHVCAGATPIDSLRQLLLGI